MIKLEIILLFLAIWYSIYYIFDKIFSNYDKIKKIASGSAKSRPLRNKKTQENLKEQRTSGNDEIKEKEYDSNTNKAKSSFNKEEKEKLKNIIKRVHLNKVRWYNDKARTLIIEWLTIDKNNRDLNMELADIYGTDKEYSKAEYIYKDILQKTPDDIDVLKLLAKSLEMQDKNKDAINIYQKAHIKKKSDLIILEKLSELTFDVQDYSDAMTYIKLYLKQIPRDAEKIAMLWYCLEKDDNIEKAIEEYERALQIQPYNDEIQTRITKLNTKIKN